MGSNNVRDIIFYAVKEQMIKKDFFIVNADFTGRPFLEISKEYPERFVQVGIAEQNMIAIASGLALAGKRVVTFSPNPFEYLRAYDQIRNAVCAMNLPITIVANGMGLVNTGLGITHFTTEDYQLFSLCPNMQIFTITDECVAKSVSDHIINGVKMPSYVRIDFECDGVIKADGLMDFEKGFRIMKNGSEKLIIAQGYSVKTACRTSFNIQPTIIDLFRHPYDQEALVHEMIQYNQVIVCEEQQLRGGVGSQILEYLNDRKINIPIVRMGINYDDKFPQDFGSRKYWMERFKVDEKALKRAVDNT